MTSQAAALLTADEFFRLPAPIEGGKMELVDGRVVITAPVGEVHSDRAGESFTALRTFVRDHDLGKVGIGLGFCLRRDPDLIRAPDVSFTATSRLDPARDQTKYIEGAPTLAVDVMSPDDREADVLVKVGEYLDAGADRVWLIRSKTLSVTVFYGGGQTYTLGIDGTLTSAEAGFEIDGFDLPLAELFG
jgi:Uma2 family endonuclease